MATPFFSEKGDNQVFSKWTNDDQGSSKLLDWKIKIMFRSKRGVEMFRRYRSSSLSDLCVGKREQKLIVMSLTLNLVIDLISKCHCVKPLVKCIKILAENRTVYLYLLIYIFKWMEKVACIYESSIYLATTWQSYNVRSPDWLRVVPKIAWFHWHFPQGIQIKQWTWLYLF